MNGLEITTAVNNIIDSLNPKDFNKAINWGDVSVCAVKQIMYIYPDYTGTDPTFEVTIEEAEPGCSDFCSVIENKFKEKYNFDIEVKTEW